MITSNSLALKFAAGLLAVAMNAVGQTASSQEQAIAALKKGDANARDAAVVYVLRSVPQNTRSPELEAALLEELARLNEARRTRFESDRAGETLREDFPAEYYGNLIEAVVQSDKPEIISVLIGALGTGRMAETGLAKFGETAVAPVADVARATVASRTAPSTADVPAEIVISAINTLERLWASGKPLSSASRNEILAVARNRLTGVQDGYVLVAAIQLGGITLDPTLLDRISRIASDQQEVRTRGVTDPWLVGRVQQAARGALNRK